MRKSAHGANGTIMVQSRLLETILHSVEKHCNAGLSHRWMIKHSIGLVVPHPVPPTQSAYERPSPITGKMIFSTRVEPESLVLRAHCPCLFEFC